MGTVDSSMAIAGCRWSCGAFIIADGARYLKDNGQTKGFAKK